MRGDPSRPDRAEVPVACSHVLAVTQWGRTSILPASIQAIRSSWGLVISVRFRLVTHLHPQSGISARSGVAKQGDVRAGSARANARLRGRGGEKLSLGGEQ